MDEAQKPWGCPKSDQEDPEVTRMGLAQDQGEPAKSQMEVPQENRVETGWPQGRPKRDEDLTLLSHSVRTPRLGKPEQKGPRPWTEQPKKTPA